MATKQEELFNRFKKLDKLSKYEVTQGFKGIELLWDFQEMLSEADEDELKIYEEEIEMYERSMENGDPEGVV